MRNVWRYACILSALLAACPARAAAIDMGTQSCQDWLDADDDQQEQMVAWLRGYLSGRATSTVYDVDHARADIAQFKIFCQMHKSDSVISAAGLWKH